MDAAAKLSGPRIINLVTDPHEREPVSLPHLHSWTAAHFTRLLTEFHASVEREPVIPIGVPVDFVPSKP
jgi:arylsulfatase